MWMPTTLSVLLSTMHLHSALTSLLLTEAFIGLHTRHPSNAMARCAYILAELHRSWLAKQTSAQGATCSVPAEGRLTCGKSKLYVLGACSGYSKHRLDLSAVLQIIWLASQPDATVYKQAAWFTAACSKRTGAREAG